MWPIIPTRAASLPVRVAEQRFTVQDGDTLFELQHRWIETDSVFVSKNGYALVPYRDYRIADPGHKLWIYTPLAGRDTLNVRYAYSPIPLLRSYVRRELRELEPHRDRKDSTILAAAVAIESEGGTWTSLRRSGSLVRSVQIGTNQDLTFESALSLQVEGRVGENVEVIAALSDQDLPIQPEGTTESIRELDKIFVTARSPHYEATIGDYELALTGKRYDSYARKLSGLKLRGSSDRKEAIFSAAVSRGEFQSNSFFGLESVQGPYQLTGKSGESGIVVLAGTERIWIDGVEVKRGESNDYTIDYASGQIFFTPNRLITSDTRIVAEFEYANEEFERQYFAARTALKSSALSAGVHLTYVSERDDRTRPLGLALTDADIRQIEAAGDSVEFATSSTADSLGPGGGDYVRMDTLVQGTSVSIFVYVFPSADGVPQGEWRVLFDDFGAGNGDYEAAADSLGRTFFYWTGTGAGRYLPARRLALPSRIDLTAVRIERTPLTGIRAVGEAALSTQDRNTYSSADDSDNDGAAGSLELGYSRAEVKMGSYALRDFSVTAQGRVRGKTFRDVSRSDEIEFDREWAASQSRQANETVGEAALGFSPVRKLGVSGAVGSLTREGVFKSRRLNFAATYRPTRVTSANVSHTAIASDDTTRELNIDWVRQLAEARTQWWIVRPSMRINRERQIRSSLEGEGGFRFLDWVAETEVPLSSAVSLDGSAGRRTDDGRSAAGEFFKTSHANSFGGGLRWTPVELGRGALRWAHRDKKFQSGDSANVSSDAARLELLIAPSNRFFELNATYDALKSRTEQQIQVFTLVEPGTGSYRLENGVYLPDDQGDYILVSRNTGDFEPSSEIRSSGILWLKPDELRNATVKFWSHFAFETEGTVEERTRRPLTLSLLLLDPGALRTNETIDGRFLIRQDVHFNRLSRRFSLRARGVNSASQVSRFSNGAQQTIRRQGSLRVRAAYRSDVRGETEIRTELDRSVFTGVSVASTDVNRSSLTQDVLWSVTERWEAGLQVALAEASDDHSSTQASVRELAPRIGYSRFNRGRVDAEFRWVHLSSNRGVPPQDVGNGANRGENLRWSLRTTLALSDTFSGSLNYSARQDAGERTVHIGRVEVRATF
ncbi:MAG: hypothetical protein H6505_00280 [Calditrichaeota bacterium]|nr:hypothetical protein [Calditrichota bacterium]